MRILKMFWLSVDPGAGRGPGTTDHWCPSISWGVMGHYCDLLELQNSSKTHLTLCHVETTPSKQIMRFLYEVFSWMLPQALSYRINKMCSILGHLLDLKIFYLCFQCYSIQTIEQISTNIRSLKTNISDKIAPGLEC